MVDRKAHRMPAVSEKDIQEAMDLNKTLALRKSPQFADELISAGLLTIAKRIDKFDPSVKVDFAGFCRKSLLWDHHETMVDLLAGVHVPWTGAHKTKSRVEIDAFEENPLELIPTPDEPKDYSELLAAIGRLPEKQRSQIERFFLAPDATCKPGLAKHALRNLRALLEGKELGDDLRQLLIAHPGMTFKEFHTKTGKSFRHLKLDLRTIGAVTIRHRYYLPNSYYVGQLSDVLQETPGLTITTLAEKTGLPIPLIRRALKWSTLPRTGTKKNTRYYADSSQIPEKPEGKIEEHARNIRAALIARPGLNYHDLQRACRLKGRGSFVRAMKLANISHDQGKPRKYYANSTHHFAAIGATAPRIND
jgi:hypothetical protein